MMESFLISLDGIRLYGRIGVFEQERKVGNEFRIDVSIKTDASGFVPEDLTTSVSYADIYEIIRAEMSEEWLLLESVAKSIADKVLDGFMQVMEISVRITKLSAPIPGIRGECSVGYTKSRE